MMKELGNIIDSIAKKSLFLQVLDCFLWLLVEPAMSNCEIADTAAFVNKINSPAFSVISETRFFRNYKKKFSHFKNWVGDKSMCDKHKTSS